MPDRVFAYGRVTGKGKGEVMWKDDICVYVPFHRYQYITQRSARPMPDLSTPKGRPNQKKNDSPEHEVEGQDLRLGRRRCEVAGLRNDVDEVRWCLGMTYPTWVHSNFSIVNTICCVRRVCRASDNLR